ncbi:hypothetical protein C8F01DRAFT_1107694 [Mycena amicta]|nr:hypothetical protein C8F01DRAFT_1107694 [Mycena amicta]
MSTVQVTGFSLSDTPELEYILADVPFFCLGAAILDLTQILLRGTANTNQGLALATVTGIVNAREVGFALAFGARYLYLWAYVAQRPRYEPRPSSQIDPLFSTNNIHSASWERWGVPGLVLKYTLLAAVLSIPILQIIWRIATGNSPVYIAESGIQIAVSVLLMGKLLLNLFLTTVAPWWRPFLPYIVPIFALLISMGIGAGNVLFFRFSETTLGRFLQAVETYSLLTSLLVFTFYKVPRYKPPPVVSARKRSSFFTGLPKSPDLFTGFQLASPTKVETSNTTEPIQQPFAAAYDRPVSRESRLSRIGSWVLTPRRKAPRPPSGEQKLWDSSEAELGISTQVRAASPLETDVEDVLVLSPRVQVLEDKPRLPRHQKKSNDRHLASGIAPPTPTTIEVTTPSSAARPYTGVSFASYYGMATNSRLTMPSVTPGQETRSTDSPVYGLDGIIPPSAPPAPESPILPVGAQAASPRPPPSPSLAPSIIDQRDSTNSFDELLRQQTELDKSIAALRLFSQPTSNDFLQSPPEPTTSRESNEFSLSIFPDPPFASRSGELPESLISGGRARRQSRVPMSAVSELLVDGLSTPGTPAAHTRFDSAGTQYDVTSFIGDLTIPGSEPQGSLLSDVSEKPESESDMESPVITTRLVTEYPVLRPLLLSSSVPAVSSPLSAGARRSPGQPFPRKPSRRGERPLIGEESTAFESPRRPPALK